LKLNLKIGAVAAVAAVLVAIGVFGLGSGSTTGVKADVSAGNVYLIPQHFIPGKVGAAGADFSCADAAPNGTNTVGGGLAINTTNFPPANTGFSLATSPTTTAFPAGLPLVEINNVSSQNLNSSVLAPGSVVPLFTSNNFIYICVNTNAISSQTAPNGINTGTINYDTSSVAGGHCLGTAAVAAGGNAGCDGDVTFSAIVQSNMGFFDQPSCSNPDGDASVGEWTDDRCINTTGEGTAQLEIPNGATNNVNTVIARFNCATSPLATGLVFPITIQQDAGTFTFNVICKGEASGAATTIQAIPNTVEIIPARGNTSHSFIWVKIHDANGNPVFPGRDVDFRTDRCSIETAGLGSSGVNGTSPVLGTLGDGPGVLSFGSVIAMTSQLNAAAPGSYANWEFSAPANTPIDIFGAIAPGGTVPLANFGFAPMQDFGKTIDGFALNGITPEASSAGAILSCNPAQAAGVTPGVANVSACIQVLNNLDVCVNTTVKVIGPPASITVAASPTSVTCGEKSTITATVVDSIGQNVSDHTRVELVTNLGGVIGGTGAVAGFAANIAPVSSSVADTFGGVATAFLITSDVTSGPYEVIATSGGTTSGDFGSVVSIPASSVSFNQLLTPVALPGTFAPYTIFPTTSYLGGQFSTPPVSAQVTVNCALPVVAAPAAPAPAIVAPRTGTGIIPPNTGDAGLVGSSSSSSWTFVALGGVFALTFAGLAAAKFARR
jgi:hypothetical protein